MPIIKTIRDFNVSDKRVLVRCDFNVPLDNQGNILDDFKIKATLPTLVYLIKNQAKTILITHLDDPVGVTERLRLDRVKESLSRQLNRYAVNIFKADDCIGEAIKKMAQALKPTDVLVLENLRFHQEEKENDENFAKELAGLGNIYLNDAFAECHRPYASMVGVPKYLPKAMGLLLEKEICILTEMMENPKRPLVAVIGGKKVETKAKLVDKISGIADFILIGGLIQKELLEKNISVNHPKKIVAPIDFAINNLDLGPKTIKLFTEKILQAKTVFWNGPLGKIEEEEFSFGTKKIAEAIIESKAFSIVGGGETVEFVNKFGLANKFNHVSTGGGAMLSFLAGEIMPGIEALK